MRYKEWIEWKDKRYAIAWLTLDALTRRIAIPRFFNCAFDEGHTTE
jgi:hypothetical protein